MVQRIIYKKIVTGDLRKFSATSNDTASGGGARDLRFSPAEKFYPEFKLMFPHFKDDGILHGYLYWGTENIATDITEVEIYPPTQARPQEVRLAKIHKCFPVKYRIVDNGKYQLNEVDYCILLLIEDDNKVWPWFASKFSLEHDNWDERVKEKILKGLNAIRKRNITPMGYIDFCNGVEYTNGK